MCLGSCNSWFSFLFSCSRHGWRADLQSSRVVQEHVGGASNVIIPFLYTIPCRQAQCHTYYFALSNVQPSTWKKVCCEMDRVTWKGQRAWRGYLTYIPSHRDWQQLVHPSETVCWFWSIYNMNGMWNSVNENKHVRCACHGWSTFSVCITHPQRDKFVWPTNRTPSSQGQQRLLYNRQRGGVGGEGTAPPFPIDPRTMNIFGEVKLRPSKTRLKLFDIHKHECNKCNKQE